MGHATDVVLELNSKKAKAALRRQPSSSSCPGPPTWSRSSSGSSCSSGSSSTVSSPRSVISGAGGDTPRSLTPRSPIRGSSALAASPRLPNVASGDSLVRSSSTSQVQPWADAGVPTMSSEGHECASLHPCADRTCTPHPRTGRIQPGGCVPSQVPVLTAARVSILNEPTFHSTYSKQVRVCPFTLLAYTSQANLILPKAPRCRSLF